MKLLALVLLVVALAAGCGGDDAGSTETWAGDVCGELSEWITEVDEAVKTATQDGLRLEADDARPAVEQVRAASDELASDLSELGPPETEAGTAAQAELEDLSAAVRTDVARVERALERDAHPFELTALVVAAFSSAASEARETFERLRQLDAGELEQAFADAESCAELREQVAELGA